MLTLESGDAVVCCFLEQDLCGWGFQDQIHCSCANMVGFIVHLYFICMHLLCFKKISKYQILYAFGWVATSNGPREILMENLQGLASDALIILPAS